MLWVKRNNRNLHYCYKQSLYRKLNVLEILSVYKAYLIICEFYSALFDILMRHLLFKRDQVCTGIHDIHSYEEWYDYDTENDCMMIQLIQLLQCSNDLRKCLKWCINNGIVNLITVGIKKQSDKIHKNKVNTHVN